jgi:hypothetical protein
MRDGLQRCGRSVGTVPSAARGGVPALALRRAAGCRRAYAPVRAMLVVAFAVAGLSLSSPYAAAAKGPAVLPLGSSAPAGTFTTPGGGTSTLDAFHGQATLVWFVTTWCQRCQTGTQTLAANINALASYGVHVVELEVANNLGRQGPSLTAFGRQFAGKAFGSPNWTWGEASKWMTTTFDPGGYDNLYYLIAGDGHLTYVNASPDATMQALLTAAVDLSRGITSPIGPEGVPEPAGPAVASLAQAASGKTVDGIACSTSEQLLFHVHTHLTIFVAGKEEAVPAGIGIAPPRSAQTSPYGAFVDGGSCFYWLHTHAADGIIHIESPVKRQYTLGEFFDIWGQPLGPDQVGPTKGKVSAFVNGQAYSGNPRAIALGSDVQIQLEVGTPVVKPRLIQFPSGL